MDPKENAENDESLENLVPTKYVLKNDEVVIEMPTEQNLISKTIKQIVYGRNDTQEEGIPIATCSNLTKPDSSFDQILRYMDSDESEILKENQGDIKSEDYEDLKVSIKRNVSTLKAEKALHSAENFTSMYNNLNDWHIYLLGIFAILSFADIISEIVLASNYLYSKDYKFFAMTLTFILIPSLVMYYLTEKTKSRGFSLIKFLMNGFLFKNTINYALEIKHAKEVEEKKKYFEILKIEYINTTSFQFLKGVSETSPQLIIQTSILLFMHINGIGNQYTRALQIITIVLSIIVLTITIITWDCSIQLEENPSAIFPLSRIIIQFGAYFFVIASRMISISLLASVHPYYCLNAIFIHWIVTALWIYQESSAEPTFTRIQFSIISASVYTFLPVSFNKLKNYLILYAIFCCENIGITIFWFLSSPEDVRYDSVYILFLCINYISFAIGGILTLYFFKKLKK